MRYARKTFKFLVQVRLIYVSNFGNVDIWLKFGKLMLTFTRILWFYNKCAIELNKKLTLR